MVCKHAALKIKPSELTVDGDSEQITNLLDLGTGQADWSQIPEDKMVVGALSLQLVSMANKHFTENASVRDDLLGICLPCWRGDLKERGSDGCNGIVMRTTLASGEDGIIDALFEVLGIFNVLSEEDETSSRTTEGFVADIEVRMRRMRR